MVLVTCKQCTMNMIPIITPDLIGVYFWSQEFNIYLWQFLLYSVNKLDVRWLVLRMFMIEIGIFLHFEEHCSEECTKNLGRTFRKRSPKMRGVSGRLQESNCRRYRTVFYVEKSEHIYFFGSSTVLSVIQMYTCMHM